MNKKLITIGIICLAIIIIPSSLATLYYTQDNEVYGTIIVVDDITEYRLEMQRILEGGTSQIPSIEERQFYVKVVNAVLSGEYIQPIPTIKAVPYKK